MLVGVIIGLVCAKSLLLSTALPACSKAFYTMGAVFDGIFELMCKWLCVDLLKHAASIDGAGKIRLPRRGRSMAVTVSFGIESQLGFRAWSMWALVLGHSWASALGHGWALVLSRSRV